MPYTRQETLGPQLLLQLDILCVFEIPPFGVLMIIVESWYMWPPYI